MKNSSSTKMGEANIDCIWNVDGFTNKLNSLKNQRSVDLDSNISNCQMFNTKEVQNTSGFDSKPFVTKFNGINMKWNVSIRFLTGDKGERVLNPVALCLNSFPNVDGPVEVICNFVITYQFGIFNYQTNRFEKIGDISSTDCQINQTDCQKIKSIGFKTLKISNRHLNLNGGIKILCNTSVTYAGKALPLSSYINSSSCCDTKPDLVIETGDSRKYHVHKQILLNQSPVFDEILTKNIHMLQDSTKLDSNDNIIESNLDFVRVNEFNSEVLEEMLYFMYAKSLINANRFAKTLIDIAYTYKLTDLKKFCEQHLEDNLSSRNLSETLLIANRYKCEQLKESCLQYCNRYCDYILKDEGWCRMEEQEPELYDQVVRSVIDDKYSLCDKHVECLKEQRSLTRLNHQERHVRTKLIQSAFRKKQIIF